MTSTETRGGTGIAALLAAALALALAGTLAGARSAEAADGPWAFSYTGAPQTFTVPAEVEKLSMVVVGGAGGRSSSNLGGAPGGVSGLAVGTFDVTPGEVLTIWVGGAGRSQMGSAGVAWGFGCGAAGGPGEGLGSQNGAGGGGASAVTRGAFAGEASSCESRPDASSVLAVGGGGGGGGANEFIPPPSEEHISFGGYGGDGGDPATAGGRGGWVATGGCGGCELWYHGQGGAPNLANGGGGGGGGGGLKGGAGGAVAIEDGGGGGGGGSSFIAASAEEAVYLAGYGTGNGTVLLSAFETDIFQCTGTPQTTTVPADAGVLKAEATGGHGGYPGDQLGADGGDAGTAMAVVRVEEGEQVEVSVGCEGSYKETGGWGYGSGGRGGYAPAAHAMDGGGGGGSSGVEVAGRTILIAGGGGGGGGNGATFGSSTNGGGGAGGHGGGGGNPAADGKHAEPEGYSGGHGGKGGSVEGHEGGSGGTAGHDSLGGGGGGGGAGWFSGEGGYEGRLFPNLTGGGGGGGGGGLSGVAEGAIDFEYGTSNLGGNGLVEITYSPAEPAAIGAYGGSKQSETIGGSFAHPLEAIVTDAASRPVPDASVEFVLPGSGASGTFDSGGTTETVATGPNGVAVSSPVTANLAAGAWEASASVSGVSTPASFSLTNAPSGTATHVTASKDPATPTEDVTFTAKVSADTGTAGTPGGAVRFVVDGNSLGAPVPLSDGAASSEAVTGLDAGSHTIEARYAGTSDYLASSGALELPVEKTVTATSVSSSLNPALPTESVTFTATIGVPAGNAPYAGSVQFSVDGAPLGAPQPASNGTATSPAYETTVVGPHAVRAVVAETADYLGSAGAMTEVVDPDGTAVEVGSSANPAEYGAPLTLDATVTPRPPVTLTPTGSVAFSAGGEECTGALAGGATSCSLPGPLSPGEHEVDAAYGGDADFDPSGGSMVQRISRAKTVTDVSGSPAAESVYGEAVDFDAEVARRTPGTGTPTGTVQFALDGEALGAPVAIGPDGASAPPVEPGAGAHVITAAYGGDPDFLPNTGVTPYRVAAAETTVALSAAPEPSQPQSPVVFTADVAAQQLPSGEAPPVPSGYVQFRVDGADFGPPVELSGGRAVSPGYESFEPGRHDVVAIYLPDTENFDPSATKIVHAVDQPTAVTVASAENPTAQGEAIRVMAHVGPLAPAGTIDFSVDGAPAPGCQAVPVANSDASCTLTGLGPGLHEVRAAYSGAPLFDPSQGTLVQEVTPLPVAPLPGCKLREVRGRVLVHRSRDTVRLVARYRASAPAEVTIRFHQRKGGDRKGRLLGTLRRSFDREGRARVQKRLPATLMKRLRRDRRGFVASFAIPGEAGYCAEAFDKELDLRRQVDRQLVWFQSDSVRADLPRDPR